MNQLEKNIKNKLHKGQMPTDDLDVTAMWDDVSNSLNERSNDRGTPVILFMQIVGFLLVLGGVFYMLETRDVVAYSTQNIATNNPDVISSDTDIMHRLDSKTKIDLIEESSLQGDKLRTPSQRQNSKKREQENTLTQTIQPDASAVSEKGKVNIHSDYRPFQTLDNSKKFSISPIYVQAISNRLGLLETKKESQSISSENIAMIDKDEVTAFSKWSMGLFTGMNRSQLMYNSTNDEAYAIALTEVPDYSWQIAFLGRHQLSSATFIETGVIYKDQWSIFSYDNTTNQYVEKDQALFKIEIDAETGDTIEKFYVDTVVNQSVYRNVKHHNNYRTVAIPLQLGFQKIWRKSYVGIALGIDINVRIKETGRSLNSEGEIIAFTENNLAQRLFFQPSLSIPVGFQLTDKLTLECLPRFTALQLNSLKENIGMDHRNASLHLGLRYAL